MGIEQWYITQVIKGLNKEEKQSMVRMITDEFIMSMSPEDRKDMVKVVLPDIIDRLMAGMTPSDRTDLIKTIMPLMIAQIGSATEPYQGKKETRNHTSTP